MCVGTMAGQKLKEGLSVYIQLPALLFITSDYFDSYMAAAFGIL